MYDSDEAAAIAHGTMQHITGLGKLQRLDMHDILLTELQLEAYQQAKSALRQGVPLQYVFGEAWFMGHRFSVGPAVLIPRPETEELVHWIIAEEKPRQIIDIGTGSGCIAVSLKLRICEAAVVAIDASEAALSVAAENARTMGVSIQFDLLDFLDAEARDALPAFDVIVSNPPYIPLTERETLHANVRDHEPAAALFVPGDDALQFYRAIADFGLTHLLPQGSIYCELHRVYAEDAATLFKGYGYSDVELKEDLHGAPRMLRARP